MTVPVSAVVMTRDEAANLPACLASLSGFAEVFVVDSASADSTADIARAFGATVVPFVWNGAYPKKKQWCLDTLPFARDWVLFLDADERLTPELAAEIAGRVADPGGCAGFFLKGRPVFLGRPLRFGGGFAKLALFDRRKAAFPPAGDLDVARMWEVEGHYQPVIAGPVGRLRARYRHEDAKPLYFWFERHNRYSDWEAALRTDGRITALAAGEPARRRWLKRLFHRLPCRPLAVFIHDYILRLGLLDGRAGFHHALARAFYYWQIDVKTLAAAQSVATAPRSPPNALTSSKVRRRTAASSIR
jgi:glycosyltransferase involved in cell wall biosynthesis